MAIYIFLGVSKYSKRSIVFAEKSGFSKQQVLTLTQQFLPKSNITCCNLSNILTKFRTIYSKAVSKLMATAMQSQVLSGQQQLHRVNKNRNEKRKYVNKQAKMESQRNVAYSKNTKKT